VIAQTPTYVRIVSNPVFPNLLLRVGNAKIMFRISRNSYLWKRLQARKRWWRGKFLSLPVRGLCNNTKRTPT